MSDHDGAPDPVDEAYVRSEALLADNEARAARRERILKAIATEAIAPPLSISPPDRRAAWGRGGWLAAASVAGLALVLAPSIYPSLQHQLQTGAPPVAVPAPTLPSDVSPTTARRSLRTPEPTIDGSLHARSAAAPSPPDHPVARPPATLTERAPQAFPGVSDKSASPEIASNEREAAPPVFAPPPPIVRAPAPATPPSAPAPIMAPAPLPAIEGPELRFQRATLASQTGTPSDPASRLRAAAAGGDIAELGPLLAQGVPVDAPDADGNTALMRSILADRPAAASLLRRYGASLDRKNQAGVTARDMARLKGDQELDRAIGLDP